jgi:hypothetical protein
VLGFKETSSVGSGSILFYELTGKRHWAPSGHRQGRRPPCNSKALSEALPLALYKAPEGEQGSEYVRTQLPSIYRALYSSLLWTASSVPSMPGQPRASPECPHPEDPRKLGSLWVLQSPQEATSKHPKGMESMLGSTNTSASQWGGMLDSSMSGLDRGAQGF